MPNAFVLFNSWDQLERDQEVEAVRGQHTKKAADLLVKKLKVPEDEVRISVLPCAFLF